MTWWEPRVPREPRENNVGNDNQPGETKFAAFRLSGAQHSTSLRTAEIQKGIRQEAAIQNTG